MTKLYKIIATQNGRLKGYFETTDELSARKQYSKFESAGYEVELRLNTKQPTTEEQISQSQRILGLAV